MKRWLFAALSLSLVLSVCVIGVHAADNVSDAEIQRLMGLDPTRDAPEEGLLLPYGEMPEFYEEDIVTEETIVLNTPARLGGGDSEHESMTNKQYDQLVREATKGNVLITKDNTNLGIQHGHSGIVYENCKSTVEALGYGKTSQEQKLSSWRGCYQVRLYYPDYVDVNNRAAAGNYAYNYLRGWSYQVLPAVTSTASLNCATLVWKAYKHGAGIQLPYNNLGSLIPQDMVELWYMTKKVSINWPGDGW